MLSSNHQLDYILQEAARKEATELKRAKLEIQRRTLELAGKKGQRHLILEFRNQPLFARNTTTEAAGDE
ncbi:hypothetical protein Tco_0565159 [Tanacetum coccineum]